MAILGRHFSISENGSVLEIFEAEANTEKSTTTILFTAKEYGTVAVVDPSGGPYGRINDYLKKLVGQDRLDEVRFLEISSITACQLWLQSGLTPYNFTKARETDETAIVPMYFDGIVITCVIHDARKFAYEWRLIGDLGNTIQV